VAADVPCRKCQYNLRGLPADGKCPECGAPVRLSIRGTLIRYSDPAWIDTLRRGINCIMIGVLTAILGYFAGACLSRGVGNSIPSILLSLCSSVLLVAGGWFLTAPDPGGVGEDAYGTSRKVIRVTLAIRVASDLIGFAETTGTFPPDVRRMMVLIGFIASAGGVVGWVATLNYLSKLADRIPDDWLAQRAQFLMYAIGICNGIFVAIIGFIALSVGPGRGPSPSSAMGSIMGLACIMIIAGIALLIFYVMYLSLLDKLNKQLKEQAELARRSWNAAAAAAT
jgi:hypothetical protein